MSAARPIDSAIASPAGPGARPARWWLARRALSRCGPKPHRGSLRSRSILPGLAIPTLLAILPLSAQELLFRQVVDPKTNTFAEAVSLFGKLPSSGFAPVRITLSNNTKRDRSVLLEFRSNEGYFGRSGSDLRSSFRLSAAAGRTEVVDLMVPVVTALGAQHGSHTSLGAAMTGDFGQASGNQSSGVAADHPGILLSQGLHTPNGSALDSEFAGKSSHRWGGLNFAGSCDPAMMPEDWRAYGGFDLLMITASEWSALAPGARTAILAWNRLGGRLVIFAPDAAANLATLGIDPRPERSAVRSFGTAEVQPIEPSLKLDPPATVALATARGGHQPRLASLIHDTAGGWPLRLAFGERAFNYILFILVLIAFGVVVGPVNLFVLARSGRRHRLFITTPVISLGASALLVVLIILQDGFGGRGARTALVEVRPDGDEHLAYVHQEQISRTGVLLGGRFELRESAAISPVPLPATRWARITQANGGGGARYLLDPGSPASTAAGDWFQSRSEQGHAITAVIPTRGRIELAPGDGPPRLVSSFEFPLEAVHFLDESGTCWTAKDLQPGKAVACSPSNLTDFQQFVDAELARLTTANAQRLRLVARRPGHFLATTTSGPFVETFGPIRWIQNHCLLCGPVAGSSK